MSAIRNRSDAAIGVLGGTFDPIHLGHLVVAEAVREALELDSMLFVPAWVNPRKVGRAQAAAEHRLEMLRLALSGNPAFEICPIEIDRGGPSYTVDTLEALRADFGARASLSFVMGADSLADLPRWHRPEDIVRLARLAVVPRSGHRPDVDALEADVPGLRRALTNVEAPVIEISATAVRARAAAGRSIRYLVPEPVREYIEGRSLYSDSGGQA